MVKLFQVDAFTDRPFAGNPAAVCLLDQPAEAAWMQAVGAEMNLSETAFVTAGDPRGLRWFTPTTEVDLCGHATLASAHVLWSEGLEPKGQAVAFSTRSGILTASSPDEWIELDLPAQAPIAGEVPGEVRAALGVTPVRTATSTAFDVLEVDSEDAVRRATPDLAALRQYHRGYILTAQSDDGVVCRVFAPGLGIDEDPATGSAQCVLGPWWRARLQRDQFMVRQLSRRGGVLRVRVGTDRVRVAGQAVTTVRGTLLSSGPSE
jgi:PhzF family phenazine biosynthesis protein